VKRGNPAGLARAKAALAAPALVLVALALAGCGLAVGPAPSAGQLLITREFGARVVHRSGVLHAGAHETVLAQLQRSYSVTGGGPHTSVTAIGALAEAPLADGETLKWLYYVNGVQVSRAPARRAVHAGDHVWWDLHDATNSNDAAAVVGAYPEPFLNGTEGKRLPVRVECASDSQAACRLVTARLRAAGVPAAVAAIGSGGAPETLRVMKRTSRPRASRAGRWKAACTCASRAAAASWSCSTSRAARCARSAPARGSWPPRDRPRKRRYG